MLLLNARYAVKAAMRFVGYSNFTALSVALLLHIKWFSKLTAVLLS